MKQKFGLDAKNKEKKLDKPGNGRSPLRFFLLVFVFSVPFWLFGAEGAKLTKAIPINLPISALGFICPISAAVIMTYSERRSSGVKDLLRRIGDYNSKRKIWFAVAILLMPAIMVLSYVVLDLIGPPLPSLHITLQTVLIALVLVAVFFIAAFGEEIGWSGYATDPMQNRWGALLASLILGTVWALWHAIPYVEANNSVSWIIWQCLFTVAARVIIVWIYNKAGKSVLAATLFHTMINVSTFLFPVYGSYYNPEITGLITIVFAAVIVLLWGSKTLATFRGIQATNGWPMAKVFQLVKCAI